MQHRTPIGNTHQVADNTDFDNYIKLPLALQNNSELKEDIFVFGIKGQSNMYNIKINHSNLPVITDPSSLLNILDEKLYTNIKPCKISTAKFYATKGSSGKTAESLDLLCIGPVKTNTIQQHSLTNQLVACKATSPHRYQKYASEPLTDHIVQCYSDVF